MYKIFSKINKKKILHIFFQPKKNTKSFCITHPKEELQCLFYNFDKNKTIKAHRHLFKKKEYKKIKNQESWLLISGLAEVSYFDLDNKLLFKKIMKPGNISITFDGIHELKILKKNTQIFEFKNGPYEGHEHDLEYI